MKHWGREQLLEVRGQPQFSVSTAAQYSVSSVVTVVQTTQITGLVWQVHTPSSGYTHTHTHIHLKLTGPRLHNRCFLRSSRATRNPKPLECVWVNDATSAKAPALAGCTLLPQRREQMRGERKQAEVGGRAAKLDQNWDSATACLQSSSASSEFQSIEVRHYEFQKEMWAISFCFIAEGYDRWFCRC